MTRYQVVKMPEGKVVQTVASENTAQNIALAANAASGFFATWHYEVRPVEVEEK
jgi:hypothetical protein